jgi:cation:H+ antiporter
MPLHSLLELLGLIHPITYTMLFMAASLLVVWRMEAMLDRGLEGTALGTLVLPYCSGLGNLVFVGLMIRETRASAAEEVVVNSLVNNASNLTVLLALPALIWGLNVGATKPAGRSGGRRRKAGAGAAVEQRLSRLSLMLTLAAAGFFLGALWLLGRDGRLDGSDGAVLVGLFLFWQCVQVFDTLKHTVRQRVVLGFGFAIDVVLALLGAWVIFESLEWLVEWLTQSQQGFFRAEHLGWITGWLLVLPNALLAFYYAARRRGDIVYSSQIGDGHICIPLAIGIFALFRPVVLPTMFEAALAVIAAATLLHLLCVALLGYLPRPLAALLVLAYGWLVYRGLLM